MRRLTIATIAIACVAAGFTAGYLCRDTFPVSSQIEDYALTNVLEDVGYVHYLAKGDYSAMRSLLDVEMNRHLSRARLHRGSASDPAEEAARVRTLNAVAVIWDSYPPFKTPEWQKNETNASWWSDWFADHAQNLVMLEEAKARCAAMPALNCRAQAPAVKLHDGAK